MLLLLFVLVASTSFLFAAAPRLFSRVTDDAMRYAAATASPAERDVWLYATGSIGPGTGGVSAVRAYGARHEADFPASIERLISSRYLGFTSVRLAVPQSIIFLSLRYQDGLTDATRLVAGRWPADLGMPLRQTFLGQDTDAIGQAPPTVFEAALSTAEADMIGARLGDHLQVKLDPTDPLTKSAYGIAPTQVDVVGLYEPLDSNAGDLLGGSGLLQASVRQGAAGIEAIYATAFVAAETYPSIAAGGLPVRYDWRFQVDPARLDADQVDTLQPDLRRLDLIAPTTDSSVLPEASSVVAVTNVFVHTGLLGILDRFAAVRARSESILSIAALGPIGLAGAAIAMLALLLVRRRRSNLLLARGRGASSALLLGAQLVEAIVLTGSASIVGLLLAMSAVPGRDSPLSPILALVVAAASTLLLVAATWPTTKRALIQLERDDPPVLRVPARRLVVEATIVGIALVAVVLLRQRGLTVGPVGETARFDPLLAAVPLLSGLAAGIVATRLYPLPVRALGWLAARRRDFVPVVGLRAVARHPATANLPLLVLMLTGAFGAFASVIESSIDRGQVAASYLEVGADYRLEAIGVGGLPASLDPGTISGVQAVASASVDSTATFVSGYQQATIELDALDAPAYATVTAGTAADPAWPSAFLAPPSGAGIGTAANPIPAIVSLQFLPSIANLGPGDTFTVMVARQPLTLRLVERRAGFPGLGGAANFAIVPLDWMSATAPAASLAPTVMWLRASSDAAAPLATMASATAGRIRIVSRQDAYGLLHDAPLGTSVADGFGAALIVAVLYLAVTLVGAVIMSAARRTRDLAYLRTLGVSTRQALALTAVEHAPPVLLALVPGVLLGVGVAILVGPGLGLADFVGAQGLPIYVDWPALALVVVALSVVVLVAIAGGAWLAGRARLVSALRIEES